MKFRHASRELGISLPRFVHEELILTRGKAEELRAEAPAESAASLGEHDRAMRHGTVEPPGTVVGAKLSMLVMESSANDALRVGVKGHFLHLPSAR